MQDKGPGSLRTVTKIYILLTYGRESKEGKGKERLG